ncbi:hypothetical protein OC834_001923 [Tilletia horrida]|nr:hypothetical protein OC834_001923 [Tilletia horrida]
MSPRSSSKSAGASLSTAPPSALKAVFDHSANFRSLVVIQESFVQSAVPIFRELIARNTHSGGSSASTILVSALRIPQVYLANQGPGRKRATDEGRLIVLDGSAWLQDEFADESASSASSSNSKLRLYGSDTFASLAELLRKLQAQLENGSRTSRVTVIIDSLDELVDAAPGGAHAVVTLIRSILGVLNALSRLVVGLRAECPGVTSSRLLDQITSPLVWPASTAESATTRGATTVIRMHQPAFIGHVYRTYGLRPPTSGEETAAFLATEGDVVAGHIHQINHSGASPSSALSRTRRTAEDHAHQPTETASSRSGSADTSSPQDIKFWEILSLLASRGEVSIRAASNDSDLGWWTQDRMHGGVGLIDGLSSACLSSALQSRPDQTITLADVLGASKREKGRRGGHGAGRSSGAVGGGGGTLDGDAVAVGLVLLEARHRTQTGKLEEEILGCTSTPQGRLRLHALDMVDRRAAAPERDLQPPTDAPLPHSTRATAPGSGSTAPPVQFEAAAKAAALSFNLTETEEQRARRAEVPLPYAHMQSQEPIMFDQGRMGIAAGTGTGSGSAGPTLGGSRRGHTGKSTILFEPESDDDEDDEDPDDDLDF